MNAVQNSLLRFGLVGLVGLLVDAGVTLYSFEFLGISPATAKVAGFVLAVSVTYFLHHYYTFALREPALNGVRILQYVAAQAICVLVNVGVFLGVIGLFGETDPAYPSEVEQVIWEHPAVQDCAVIGVPDDKWGEAVKGVVELNKGMSVEGDELIALCRERLGGVKTPKTIDFVAELPRSANGKVLKKDVRAAYWADAGRKI